MGFLLGQWTLSRSIEDHRSGNRGSFVGTAALVEADPGSGSVITDQARYDESGELRFRARTSHACRSLIYTRVNEAAVMLHFADGRPFVDLDLTSGPWTSIHDCGEDVYELETTALSQELVRERWRVRGPNKDYDAITTLTRLR